VLCWSMSGFWGTSRQVEWERRKSEGHLSQRQLQSAHENQMSEKEGVLDIARHLLDASRPTKRARLDDVDDLRSNLLALSYAMFDSLFGTKHFSAAAFCNFLVSSGEQLLAEQIALAAVERSRGSGFSVDFVLNTLVPTSPSKNDVIASLRGLAHCMEDGGLRLLALWQKEHCSADEAFETALRIKDNLTCLQTTLPMVMAQDAWERRERLQTRCSVLLSKDVIGLFTDEQWPHFIDFLFKNKCLLNGARTDPEHLLAFAATMAAGQKRDTVVTSVLDRRWPALRRKLVEVSASRPKNMNCTPQQCQEIRDEAKRHAQLFIDHNSHELLRPHLAPLFEAEFLPPTRMYCGSPHKTLSVERNCRACVNAARALAVYVGVLLAIREHEVTVAEPRLQRLGLPFTATDTVNRMRAADFLGPFLSENVLRAILDLQHHFDLVCVGSQ